MSQINLQINFNPKVVAAALVVIGIATLAYKIPETKAQASPAPTGKFGCMLNTNPLAYLAERTDKYAFINQIGVLDFDTLSGNFSITNVLAFNTVRASNQNDEVSATYSIVPGPFAGAFTVSARSEGNSADYILIPVNSGNTLLIKSRIEGKEIPDAGVCQKI
jgi:hypothetical protein